MGFRGVLTAFVLREGPVSSEPRRVHGPPILEGGTSLALDLTLGAPLPAPARIPVESVRTIPLTSHTPSHTPQQPQLVGFLYNNGTSEICDMKLKSVNAPGLTALWPDWASDASYERYFNLKQVTAVGLTAAANADGSMPSVQVTSMRPCSEDANTPLHVLLSRKVDIT